MNDANPLTAELALNARRIEALLRDRSEEELRRRPTPGEWSAKEIVCHLRDASQIFDGRVVRVSTETRPFLPSWNEQEHARAGNYLEAESATLARSFEAQREQTLTRLAQLAPADWQRGAVHEENGDMTLAQLAIDVAYHEAMHLRDLARLLGGVTARA